jgi:energy-coupling factor transport system permease protein
MSILVTPILANAGWRIGLVGLLLLLTLAAGIPLRVWRQQLGWLVLLSGLVMLLTFILCRDGLEVNQPDRWPAPASVLPQPSPYGYVLLDWGPLTVTRRSLELGIRVGTLLFTLIYGTNLYLLTTAPEEITLALESSDGSPTLARVTSYRNCPHRYPLPKVHSPGAGGGSKIWCDRYKLEPSTGRS